ncbi:sulfatase-like hydrolase/transferase [Marinilabilia salmonicolor]|uniref:sulfatase-like hydrolase/transferase n=1 Tax=Marinilabilia salmonicolor TaxID=989 RepID=UPI000B1EE90A|nr:sulfatase-like hydrolase/transferase [Marinilabilia salmonicolor]
MEKLAEEGVKFTQAYACAVCSPTRVSLISGMNAARHRVTNWTLKRNASNDRPHPSLNLPQWNVNGPQPTDSIENSVHITPLPKILQDHGYYTVHSGKAHWGAIGTPAENPINLGFDVNIAGHAAGGPGSFLGEKNYSAQWRNGGTQWDVPGLEKYHGTDTYLTEALTIEAIKALQKPVSQRQPFYLYMAHYAVHVPIEKDKRFIQKYLDKGLDETEAAYASMIEGMDKSLGDLMTFLDKNNLTENTIILFMSDNGGLSACPGRRSSHAQSPSCQWKRGCL